MKKASLIVLIPLILAVLFIGVYAFIDNKVEREKLSQLEKHTLSSEEKIVKRLEYEKQKYVISKYYDDTSSWSHLRILLDKEDNYYILKDIKKCDVTDDGNNIYVKDNVIYIHCIGKEGDIEEYKLDDMAVEKSVRKLDYKNAPNISQLHLLIDKVDENYIYLSSFKLDNTLENGERVKCSLEDNVCHYY